MICTALESSRLAEAFFNRSLRRPTRGRECTRQTFKAELELHQKCNYGGEAIDGVVSLYLPSINCPNENFHPGHGDNPSARRHTFTRGMEITAFGLHEVGVAVVCRLTWTGRDKHPNECVLYEEYTALATKPTLPALLPYRIIIPSSEPPSLSLPGCELSWEVDVVCKDRSGECFTVVDAQSFCKACLYKPTVGLVPRACALRKRPSFHLTGHVAAKSVPMNRDHSHASEENCNSSTPNNHERSLPHGFSWLTGPSHVQNDSREEMFLRASLGCHVYEIGDPVAVTLWFHLPRATSTSPMTKIRSVKAFILQTATVELDGAAAYTDVQILDSSLIAPPDASAPTWTQKDNVYRKKINLQTSGSYHESTFNDSVPSRSPKRTTQRGRAISESMFRWRPHWRRDASLSSNANRPSCPCRTQSSMAAPTFHKTTLEGRRGATKTVVTSVRHHVCIRVRFYCRHEVKLTLPFTLSSAVKDSISDDDISPSTSSSRSFPSSITPSSPAGVEPEYCSDFNDSTVSSSPCEPSRLFLALYGQDAPTDYPPPYHRLAGESMSLPSLDAKFDGAINARASGRLSRSASGSHSWFDLFAIDHERPTSTSQHETVTRSRTCH